VQLLNHGEGFPAQPGHATQVPALNA
jgi:hypothetical protein